MEREDSDSFLRAALAAFLFWWKDFSLSKILAAIELTDDGKAESFFDLGS